jgi:hypothetical protein
VLAAAVAASLDAVQLAAIAAVAAAAGGGFPPGDSPPVSKYHHGWFFPAHKVVLSELLTKETRCVLELGSWLGSSTRFIAEHAPNAVIICVDLWDNSFVKEAQGDHYLKNELQVCASTVKGGCTW